jgi:hypothetical protein
MTPLEIVSLLKTLGIIKDPEAERTALAALQERHLAFLRATDRPEYAILRLVLVGLVFVDALAFGGERWAALVANLGRFGMAGYVEIGILLWVILGPEVVSPLAAAVGRILSGPFSPPPAARQTPPPPPPTNGRLGGRREL